MTLSWGLTTLSNKYIPVYYCYLSPICAVHRRGNPPIFGPWCVIVRRESNANILSCWSESERKNDTTIIMFETGKLAPLSFGDLANILAIFHTSANRDSNRETMGRTSSTSGGIIKEITRKSLWGRAIRKLL